MTPEIWEVPKLTPSPKEGLNFLSFTALKISSEEAFQNMFFLQKLKCICWLLESLETCVSPIPVINVSVEYVSFGKFQIRHYVKWPLWVFGCVWPSVDQQFKEKTIAERSGPFLRSEAKPWETLFFAHVFLTSLNWFEGSMWRSAKWPWCDSCSPWKNQCKLYIWIEDFNVKTLGEKYFNRFLGGAKTKAD